jgi:hypothetical protein
MNDGELRGRSPDPLGNPLAGALDAAASWPEAAGYEVPVPTIRRRVRRRRAARRAAVGGGACVVAAGVVVAAPGVWGFLGATPSGGGAPVGAATGDAPVPAAASDGSGTASRATADAGAAAAGDWPAQFDRCGKPVGDLTGSTKLTVTASSMAADATWHATTIVSQAPTATGQVVGTDVSLVRDGVVVAVQEGPQVQQPEGLTATTVPQAAGPSSDLTSDVVARLVSCAQYPSGSGSVVVEPGPYELVAVQTVVMTNPGGSWAVHATVDQTVDVPGE